MGYAYRRWAKREDYELLQRLRSKTIKELSKEFQRTPNAVKLRIKKVLKCDSYLNNGGHEFIDNAVEMFKDEIIKLLKDPSTKNIVVEIKKSVS
ncbi:hypothetical protein GEMRC1_005721 [Eukaryota sp. GEM-RC1]